MDNHVIHQNRIRQILLLVVIALLGILLFRELYFFLPALLGAVTLYMVMRKMMFYLTVKRKWRKVWAALLLMFVSMIIIMFPIGILINMLSSKVSYVIDHSNEMIESLKKVVATIELRFNFQLVSEENLNKLGSLLAKGLPKLLSATFNTLGTIFFMYFLLYFMLINAKSMEKDLY
jgi:predicted PurR-regulated permease PerM